MTPHVLSQNSDRFRKQLYDEQWLYVRESDMGGLTLIEYASANFPMLNRLLVPVMIHDHELGAYRFPGAVVLNNDTDVTAMPSPAWRQWS